MSQNGSIFHFDLQIEGIQSILSIDDDAEVGSSLGEFDQCGLYLTGENNQASDRDGIVATSFNGTDLWVRATTGATLLPPGAGEVTAAIANHGCAIGVQPGPDQFAIFTLFNWLAGLGVNAFDQESISPSMHAITNFTFTGHAWSQELCHAKFVIGYNTEQFLQLRPGLPWPWLSTKETDPELRLAEIQSM